MYIQHVNMAMLLVRIQPTLAAVIIKKMFVDPSATAFIVFITVDHIFLLLSCRSCVLLPCTRWLCLCRPDNTACPGLPLLIFQRPKKSEEPIFGGADHHCCPGIPGVASITLVTQVQDRNHRGRHTLTVTSGSRDWTFVTLNCWKLGGKGINQVNLLRNQFPNGIKYPFFILFFVRKNDPKISHKGAEG